MLQDQRDRPVSRVEPDACQRLANRGNLRLFFGGSNGRTAVRTMLETAAAGRRIGADVVVGSVISGGCRIIDQLLRGFECLPGTRGAARIDLDSVRRRAPSILLIDTCICDIEPIVALGVSVWAAVDATGLCSWTTVTEVGAAPFASLSRL